MPSAAILTGGRARRFDGRNKSALVVEGRTILERQVAELSAVADDIMLVGSGGPGAAGAVRHVPDRAPGLGPLAGLDAALEAARHPVLLLVACDMPFVTAALFARLVQLAADAEAVVPSDDRGYHPLCAAYARSCRPAVARHLAEKRLKLTDLLQVLHVRTLSGPELEALGGSRLLINVNTATDYAAAAGAVGNHEP